MNQDHKLYAEAFILASRIHAACEHISITKYKFDENKTLYYLHQWGYNELRLDLEKGNRATFATIRISCRPRKADLAKANTEWLKVSPDFMAYLKKTYWITGKMKTLLDSLPSYRQYSITKILADLESEVAV
jgi:hypothetical protein